MEPKFESDVPSTRPQGSRSSTVAYRSAVFLIVVFAFLLRFHLAGVYLEERGSWDDTNRFQATAESAVDGKGLGEAVHPRENEGVDDNGMAILRAVTGDRTAASYHNALLIIDTAILLLMMGLVQTLFGRGAAVVCGLILAVYLPGILAALTGDVPVFAYYFAVVVMAATLWLPRSLPLQLAVVVVAGLVTVPASMISGMFLWYSFVPALFLTLKYWNRKGLLLAIVLLTVSLGGNLISKGVFKNPTHQFWHSVYVGFGEFPNRMGMEDVDQAGFDAVYDVTKREKRFDKPSGDVLKNLSFILIEENPVQYLQSLMQRTWKVLLAPQRWRFFHLSLSADQENLLSSALFVLSLVGMALAVRERRRDSLLFVLTYFFFSLSWVPILSTQGHSYLPSSIVHVAFASLALWRLGGVVAGKQRPTILRRSEEGWTGHPDPFRSKSLVSALGVGFLIGIAGTGVFVTYARQAAITWKRDFLRNIETHTRVESWGMVSTGTSDFTTPTAVLSAPLPAAGVPYLIHAVLEIDRGRVGMQVMSREGRALSPIVHSSSVGRSNCFLSWVADSTEEVSLYLWDALPTDLEPLIDPDRNLSIRKAFDHYGIVDHAKLEWFPENRIEVSASQNEPATRRIPFQLQKQVFNLQGQPSPPVWRGRVPCTVNLEMPHQPEISNLVLHQTSVPPLAFRLEAKKAGDLVLRPLGETLRKVDEETGKFRISFDPARVSILSFHFEGGPDDPFLDLRDVSIPDPARFKVQSVHIYQTGEAAEAVGFPVRFSFQEP